MKNIIFSLFIYFSITTLYCLQNTNIENDNFLKSFINYYDFSPEGRYTHEYHPFLLNKTKDSLSQLESNLISSGFKINNRIIIMGYQQNGIPNYYSSITNNTINDEEVLITKKGHTKQVHNIFGFLTGFFLKDCNWLQKKMFPGQDLIIEHNIIEPIDLFDDNAYILQKHAFGQNFDTFITIRNTIEYSLKKQNIKLTLKQLTTFWEAIYNGNLKNYSQEILATQDILFSIDYAQHLIDSPIPITKMHIGPDITYPIESLSQQQTEATQSAQCFVKKLTQSMQSHKNEKTAYIFCSFVDGVGKSTLLGNVINFINHDTNIEKYQRIDNASSQTATIYECKDNCFIVDLPAQLSHWISKPDGYVFIDTNLSQITNSIENDFIYQTIVKNAFLYKKNFFENLTKTNPHNMDTDNLYNAYCSTCILCCENLNDAWIPCEINNNLYIFNFDNKKEFKILVPIEVVHSKGLKAIRPEQMLFTKGLSIPMNYQFFIDDLITKLNNANITSLIFVDFLSMYPRTSRENIRVNFMLQQMKTIFNDKYTISKSMYKSFVNHYAELYHLLKKHKNDAISNLSYEAITRKTLYNILQSHSKNTVTTLTFNDVSTLLKNEYNATLQSSHDLIVNLISSKINIEHDKLTHYEYDRSYELYVKFSPKALIAFSNYLTNLFTTLVYSPYMNEMWSQLENTFYDAENQSTMSGTPLIHFSQYNSESRNEVDISKFASYIRAHWYGALINLINAYQNENGIYQIKNIISPIPACIMMPNNDNHEILHIIEKKIIDGETIENCNSYANVLLNNDTDNYVTTKWIKFYNMPHCLSWNKVETHNGIYAFGFYSLNDIQNPITILVKKYITEYMNQETKEPFITTSCLLSMINENNPSLLQLSHTQTNNKKNKKQKIKSQSPQGKAIAYMIRALATLEMIIKDSNSIIITRRGSIEDFQATIKLLEYITIPHYFNIIFSEPLFQDYTTVTPVIPWNIINS